MISHIHQARSDLSPSTKIHLLYSTRLPVQAPITEYSDRSENESLLDQILFLSRLQDLVRSEKRQHQRLKDKGLDFQPLSVRLHLTNLASESSACASHLAAKIEGEIPVYDRRITVEDLYIVIGDGKDERAKTACYVCGPPKMTDELVETLKRVTGNEMIFCEKWW